MANDDRGREFRDAAARMLTREVEYGDGTLSMVEIVARAMEMACEEFRTQVFVTQKLVPGQTHIFVPTNEVVAARVKGRIENEQPNIG